MDILLRLGELTLKSRRSRRRFMNRLINNIKDALDTEGYRDYEVINIWSRILIHTKDEDDNILTVLRRIFGLVGVVKVFKIEFDKFEDIINIGEELFKEIVKGKSFAVNTRREGKHDFKSIDVNRELGRRLLKYSPKVDLKNPDITIKIEIRDRKVFYYLNEYPAYGGLPIGTDGTVLSLLSGGFDSAVASWYALRRGAEVHYFHAQLAGEAYLNKVLKVVSILAHKWSYGYNPKIYIADYREISKRIREIVRRDYRIVILKRFMYRGAEYIANKVGADSLVTGEVLGQVSSQTLRNLRVSQDAVNIPINRPLFGYDKEDIMRIAREIGTYNYSKEVEEVCALVERFPVLKASHKIAKAEEEKVGLNILDKILDDIRILDIRRIPLEYFEIQEDYPIEYNEIPSDSIIIDIRPPIDYMTSHIPESINLSPDKVFEYASKNKDKNIIIVCSLGITGREIVNRLRKAGYNAYYLVGGFEMYRKKYLGCSGGL